MLGNITVEQLITNMMDAKLMATGQMILQDQGRSFYLARAQKQSGMLPYFAKEKGLFFVME